MMGWGPKEESVMIQPELFNELPEEEQLLLNLISRADKIEFDLLCCQSGMPVNQVSAHLLNLEFAGFVEIAPGNIYTMRKIRPSHIA
jgi:predicted Rossmann fold nucleotide-binding protein DprA/Smf involved in DNA uptake